MQERAWYIAKLIGYSDVLLCGLLCAGVGTGTSMTDFEEGGETLLPSFPGSLCIDMYNCDMNFSVLKC